MKLYKVSITVYQPSGDKVNGSYNITSITKRTAKTVALMQFFTNNLSIDCWRIELLANEIKETK